jgi:hypothetical protein
MPPVRQQMAIWIAAAVVGLVLSELIGVDALGSIALVAGVGILAGIGVAARQRSGHPPD